MSTIIQLEFQINCFINLVVSVLTQIYFKISRKIYFYSLLYKFTLCYFTNLYYKEIKHIVRQEIREVIYNYTKMYVLD